MHRYPRALAMAALASLGCGGATDPVGSDLQRRVTFSEHVAPIGFQKCVTCHRPGGAGPFNLLAYEDYRKRAEQIVEVTARRYMPPWLPESGSHAFLGDRRLSSVEVATIAEWVEQGAQAGDLSHLPPQPEWTGGWYLGQPDLVVTMPQAFTLPAEGTDMWRNFAIPLPVKTTRYVKAVEFRPGNPRAVHHAAMQIDPTRKSRQLDQADPLPGFNGMVEGRLSLGAFAQNPGGQYIGWTPGKIPRFSDPGIAWPMHPASDLILQLHMPLTGKAESIRSTIGFHFSDEPPTRFPMALLLSARSIEIPAGKQDYVVELEYRLPVDVELLGVYPHAHYICQDMRGYAKFPDGTQETLIRIKEWDFNWQDEYRYVQPVFLPQGTTIGMRYVYDNSAGNPRNPNSPPQPIRYGEQSTDEMGDLLFQVLPQNRQDLALLHRDFGRYQVASNLAIYEQQLQSDPESPRIHRQIGEASLVLGQTEKSITHFRKVVQLTPNSARAFFSLGLALEDHGLNDQAKHQWEQTLRLQPRHAEAHYQLGEYFEQERDYHRASDHYRQVLAVDPKHTKAHARLQAVLKARAKVAE